VRHHRTAGPDWAWHMASTLSSQVVHQEKD